MRRLLWVLCSLWAISSILVVIAMASIGSQACYAPLIVEITTLSYIDQSLVDLRTGINIRLPRSRGFRESPSGDYYYTTSDLTSANYEVEVISTADNSSRLLHISARQVFGYWAADGQSLFIYENNRDTSPKLLQFNIHTGDLISEYDNLQGLAVVSPERLYLQFSTQDSGSAAISMQTINTVTGNVSVFEHNAILAVDSWSPDKQWMVLGSMGELFVVNTETGQAHPQIPVFNGYASYWTNESIWFQTQQDDSREISYWRASLLDSSINLEYANVIAFTASADERWRYIGLLDNDKTVSYLHDSPNDIYYPDVNISRPLFSVDGSCLVGLSGNLSNQASAELLVYDLETMQVIYRNALDDLSNIDDTHFSWYEGD